MSPRREPLLKVGKKLVECNYWRRRFGRRQQSGRNSQVLDQAVLAGFSVGVARNGS